jgi:hypothetical protein
MHLYEVVGSQGEQKYASNEMERITSFNDGQEYMSLCGPRQEETSEYQQPQRCGRNTKTAANNDEVKGTSDCHVLKDELKRTKICLRALNFLIVILFLITVLSLGLAAYCLSSTRSGNDVEYRLNTINSEVISQRTYINNLESQLKTINSSQRTFTNNVETQFNTINAEAVSQRTFINNLESQFNTTNSEVVSQRTFVTTLNSQLNSDISTVRSSVTSLQNQLTRILTNSSLQITVTNQPSK